MSTLKTTNITHGSNSGTNNLILDDTGKVSIATKKLYCPGTIIQVVQSQYTAVNNGDIAGGADWDLESIWSGTITPTASSSKILVTIMLTVGCEGAAPVPCYLHRKIGSGSAAVVQAPDSPSSRTPATIVIPIPSNHHAATGTVSYLDSPNTTDACKYWLKLRHQLGNVTQNVYLNKSYQDSDDNSYARAISTIVLQEVAG
jgi:hypothetical protein